MAYENGLGETAFEGGFYEDFFPHYGVPIVVMAWATAEGYNGQWYGTEEGPLAKRGGFVRFFRDQSIEGDTRRLYSDAIWFNNRGCYYTRPYSTVEPELYDGWNVWVPEGGGVTVYIYNRYP